MQNILSMIVPQPSVSGQMILQTNERTAKYYGLVLTNAQAMEIAATYHTSLAENRIIEVGCGGISKLIEAFAASSFVYADNYASVIHEMTEAFYHIKREVPIETNDDAVIAAMVDFFDNASHGSIELFLGRDMETLIRYIAKGNRNWEEHPNYQLKKEDSYDTAPDYTDAHAEDF